MNKPVRAQRSLFMNIERAKEIYHSTGVINVTYEGAPVWIEELHEEDELANIRGIDGNTCNTTVNVHLLEEREGIM